MGRISRREFLLRTGGAGLAASVGSPWLSGCYGEDVNEPTGVYDAIIVGGGTAGSIVATKLQRASAGKKRILVIEAGGPTVAAIGGNAYPPWAPPGRTDLTMFDVPGSYSQIPFTPFGNPYQLTETLFAFQGTGLGGNSAFNGMLFQTNPPAVFDRRWPAHWHWDDIQPYFDRVRANIPVTNTPSTDGLPQNSGPASIVHPLYAGNGWIETDTSRPFSAMGVYSRPYVAAKDGKRAGPISGYFEAIDPAACPRPASRSCSTPRPTSSSSSDGKRRRGPVHETRGVDQTQPGTPGIARLRSGGMLVLAAGALVTPRLLLLSGVGPRGREAEISRVRRAPPFAIDNPRVGVGVFDHVIAMVTYSYEDPCRTRRTTTATTPATQPTFRATSPTAAGLTPSTSRCRS